MHSKVFGSLPGLCPLDASYTSPPHPPANRGINGASRRGQIFSVISNSCQDLLESQQREVSIVVHQKRIRLVSVRIGVQSLASLGGLRIRHCTGCGVGRQL